MEKGSVAGGDLKAGQFETEPVDDDFVAGWGWAGMLTSQIWNFPPGLRTRAASWKTFGCFSIGIYMRVKKLVTVEHDASRNFRSAA